MTPEPTPAETTAAVPAKPGRLTRVLLFVALGAVLLGGAFLGLLHHHQAKLIYFPRSYKQNLLDSLPWRGVERVEFRTANGAQTAFFLARSPEAAKAPSRLWVITLGNASLGLDLLNELERFPDRSVAFLLVDYPGYGLCEGKPTPEGILENCRQALAAVLPRFEGQTPSLGAFGHSIGSGAAAQFAAAEQAVDRLVLLSPFTSTLEIARERAGPIANLILAHRFDTMARLKEISRRSDPPEVFVLHGSNDRVIPVSHGRALAEAFPEMVQYTELPNRGHDVLWELWFSHLIPLLKTEDSSKP